MPDHGGLDGEAPESARSLKGFGRHEQETLLYLCTGMNEPGRVSRFRMGKFK